MKQLFVLQKKPIRLIAELKPTQTCKNSFRELGVNTLPYISKVEVLPHFKFKRDFGHNKKSHNYGTR